MRRRRILLFVLVIYVTLDLSLAAMPGAFVFEPDDSVESLQVHRGRDAVHVILVPAFGTEMSAMVRPVPDSRQQRPVGAAIARPWARGLHHRPRAVLDPAPSSEDPH